MTNEIKEIIYLEDYINKYKSDEKAIINGNRLTTPAMLDYLEVKALLDYITNLQEEKENAVECLKYYEEKHFVKPAVDNMKLTIELYNAYSKEINNLQQRIDKAIDYINDIDEPDLRVIEEYLKGED